MDIKHVTFVDLQKEYEEEKPEGIVLLGAGGELQAWVNGVSTEMEDNGVSTTAVPEELWKEALLLTTTGGRHDLVLIFKDNIKMNLSNLAMWRLAMWRLGFGDCSWVSDYLVNYAEQHNFILEEE